MTLATPLALRWERALRMDRTAIQILGNGWCYVPSQNGSGGYAVWVEFDAAGQLAGASCTCPDFCRPQQDLSGPILHGLRVCKHILAAGLKAAEKEVAR